MLAEPAVGAEHFRRRLIVNVVAAPERLGERFIVGQVRQDAQLDLRIVGRNQHVPGVRDERAADLASKLGANRDVLQVRVAAAQPAGRRHRLVETRVDATGLRVHELGERVDVGAFQLLERPPFKNQPWQLVPKRELFEHFDRRRRRSCLARPLERRQLELLEENLGELLG